MNNPFKIIRDWIEGWPNQGPSKEIETATLPVPPEGFKADATLYFPNVPSTWQWVLKITGIPNLVKEAMREYGIKEGADSLNNKRIIAWADEVAKFFPTTYNNWSADWYNKDSIPWCGLFAAVVSTRTGRKPVDKYLTALAWSNWQTGVDFRNVNNIWTGDLGVFTRDGGGHVAVIIGVSKDGRYVLCVGGNQSNAVNIKLFPISRLYAVRRPKYTVKPLGAVHRRVSATGVPISKTEA